MQHKSENTNFFSATQKIHPIKRKGLSLKKLPSAKDVNQYTSLLLTEYYSLVESMSQLEEKEFYSIHPEINSVVDKLIKWFEETSPNNTLSIYWTLRRLKQKVEHHKRSN